MTDKELIALVESKLPQELSLEEVETIHRRLRESPAVRDALAGQLELNEYLATVISPVELVGRRRFRAGRPIGPFSPPQYLDVARLDGVPVDGGVRGVDVGVAVRAAAERDRNASIGR